jgi:hypothetical protein
MSALLDRIVGPRVTAAQLAERPVGFLLPTHALAAAAALLIASVFLPYWQMTLQAPQYPGGLHVQAHLDHLTGDVKEIDGLNHYIGMRPLGEAAQLERELSIAAVLAIALLVMAAIYIHNRWAGALALPALLFPFGFLADLYYWLRRFGTHLDPNAPLSSAIDPFVPPVLGRGVVGQFATVAAPDVGLWLAFASSLLILVGLYLHRRVYKPLLEAQRG